MTFSTKKWFFDKKVVFFDEKSVTFWVVPGGSKSLKIDVILGGESRPAIKTVGTQVDVKTSGLKNAESESP